MSWWDGLLADFFYYGFAVYGYRSHLGEILGVIQIEP